ncbi:MAG: YjbH domain-containing protein [Candidatus Eiseniibacteriota bacterium]
MTETASPRAARADRAGARRCLVLAALLLLPGGAAADSTGAQVKAADDPALVRELEELGLENLTVSGSTRTIAYENRRYRHSAEARARVASRVGPTVGAPYTVIERRLGLAAAVVVDTGGGVPAAVRYPSDPAWISPSGAPVAASTRRSVDLELVPLLTYELGRILDPVLVRVDLQPRVRYNPWPGARANASLIVPLRNDFSTDSLNPDIDRVRPGPLTLEQFMWLPGGALLSGTVGIFGANRYGISMGAARPLSGGAFLIDAQADLTGYIAFPATGTEYSSLSRWTAFAGVTYRPPALDLAVRLRAQRFLFGDDGAELELRRSMGDMDVAFFYQRTGGFGVQGIRLDVPIPPMVRPTGKAVRVLPVERLPLGYRDEVAPVGRSVTGVASREDFLRQLSLPGLAANAGRYRIAGAETGPRTGRPAADRVSFTGMTGFIHTPWCGVMSDRSVEVGYNRIPRGAAYDHRGTHANDVYYVALGFLPRVEAGLRWTVIPGLKAFVDEVPDSRLTESDRMLSGRVELLRPRFRRPGLAVGIEDAVGTRRFHSTYAVAGIPFEYRGLRTRLGLGYASRTLTASRHTLDGAFGAVEVALRRPVAVTLEYDTEKWNTSLGIDLGFGFRARTALLDWEHVSFGAGWSVAL